MEITTLLTYQFCFLLGLVSGNSMGIAHKIDIIQLFLIYVLPKIQQYYGVLVNYFNQVCKKYNLSSLMEKFNQFGAGTSHEKESNKNFKNECSDHRAYGCMVDDMQEH